MSLQIIKDHLEVLGCTVSITKNSIELSYSDYKTNLEIDETYLKSIKAFVRSNQHEFNLETRTLIGPKSVEIGITRLSQVFRIRNDHNFSSPKKRKVRISSSSLHFALSFLTSEEYKDFFEIVVKRKLKNKRLKYFKDLLWLPPTIEFLLPRKTDKSKLLEEAYPALEACLFKLALEKGECWDFAKRKKQKNISLYGGSEEDEEMIIPLAKYDSNMLKYYKVAISSQFPSQSYLAFYHILEYNFLAVSDEALNGKLKTQIHSTDFRGNEKQLQTIINLVKKHNDKSDETEMLSRVFRKYIDEEELILFITDLEEQSGEKLYSKRKTVFGEDFTVQLKKDHAISNVAKLLKHVRNALVHSSDKYNREDCHIPLTESEAIIEDYVPIVRYLAEKVIYAKSS